MIWFFLWYGLIAALLFIASYVSGKCLRACLFRSLFFPLWGIMLAFEVIGFERHSNGDRIQWTGDNVDEVLAFGNSGPMPLWGADFTVDIHTKQVLIFNGEKDSLTVEVGDWIYRDHMGVLSVVSFEGSVEC